MSDDRRAQVFHGASEPAQPKPDRIITGAIPVAAPRGEKSYELNFEDAPVTTIAKVVLGDILSVGYTIDPRVQGTISISSGRPVPQRDVLFVLENALRTSNVALVRDVAGYRLMPAGEAVGSGGVDHAVGRRPEPGYGITVLPLEHVSAQTLTKLLDSFATKPGTVRADPARNILVIQGSGAERKAAVEIALSFDADWMRGQSVGIYPVRNATPEPLISELEKVLDSGEGGLTHNMVKLQPLSRLGAILAVTRRPDLLPTVETWINRLDTQGDGNTVKVYRVRYGDARQLARILNDTFTGGSATALDAPVNQIAPGAGANTLTSTERLTGVSTNTVGVGLRTQPSAQQQSPLASPVDAPGSQRNPTSVLGAAGPADASHGQIRPAILQGVRITPDVTNNSLLIFASADSYRTLMRALTQLDKPQLQVAIELTIAEVTLKNDLNYGVQYFLKSHDIGLGADKGSIINSAAGKVLAQALPGFNFLLGPALEPRFILDALHKFTSVKVLSNPSLVVVDNQLATLQVGDQVPITTGTATLLTPNNTIVNTVDYRNTGIILRVVPRVNANGYVLLDIEQEISNVSDTSPSDTLTPTLSQRRVRSSISVASGQTVLLAGLISEIQGGSKASVPILGQVPVLGEAFGQTGKNRQRTELIIFIRPQIIRDGVDAMVVAEELRSKLQGDRFGLMDRQRWAPKLP